MESFLFRAGLGQARILACDTWRCPGCSTDYSVPRVFTENISDPIYPTPFNEDLYCMNRFQNPPLHILFFSWWGLPVINDPSLSITIINIVKVANVFIKWYICCVLNNISSHLVINFITILTYLHLISLDLEIPI